jgi:hypothetical protein
LRARWTKLSGSMRPLGVVVRSVGGEHSAQVSFSEDQHPVGEFGAKGQHEAFGEAVRPRTPWRDLDHLDARVRQDGVERGRELSGSSRTRNRNRVTCPPESMTRLRACCVVQWLPRCAVTPRMCR